MGKIKKKIKKRIKEKVWEPYSIERGVSQSMILRWMRCKQECKYYVEGWRKPGLSVAPWFGDYWHDISRIMYDSFRKGEFKGAPDEETRGKILSEASKTLMKTAKGCSSPEAMQDAEIMCIWAEVLLPAYCEHWADDFKQGVWFGLESEFDVTWNGYRLKGRRDGLRWVKPKAKGTGRKKGLWLLESKTKGRIEEGTLMDALDFDFQNEYYLTGSEVELAGEHELKGVIYNIVRRPNQKVTKKDKTLKDYGLRIAADIEKRPDHYFMRFECPYSKKERNRFKTELLVKLQWFEKWLNGEFPTFRQECSCTMGRRCDYLQACSTCSMKGFVHAKDVEKGGR